MEGAAATEQLLSEGVILLGAALVLVLVFRKLGLGAVLGYLLAGALVGPHALELVGGGEAMVQLGEIGIVMLLFLVGLELQPSRLWAMRREIFGLGLVQVVACGLALTGLIAWGLGFSWAASLALGLPLALSSTAQVLPSLKDTGSSHSPFGQRAFSILLFQDLSIVPLVTIIAALSRAPADPSDPAGWTLALMTVVAILGLWAAGRFLLTPLLRLVGRLGERELFVIVGLFVVLASAALMHELHLSTALGAFVAGVVLADSPYRHEITSDVEPFRSILLGLFFLGVGMVLDLSAVAERPVFVLSMALALVAVKTGVIFAIARATGFAPVKALALGMLLSQGRRVRLRAVRPGHGRAADRPGGRQPGERDRHRLDGDDAFPDDVRPLAAGSRKCARGGDGGDPVAAARHRDRGRLWPVRTDGRADAGGPGLRRDDHRQQAGADRAVAAVRRDRLLRATACASTLLRSAGAEEARLICFCTDDAGMGAEALAPVQQAFPDAALLVRAFDRRQLIALAPLDDAQVVREVYESAICMGRLALGALGADAELLDRVEREYRDTDVERLRLQTETGDLKAAKDMIYRPGNTMSFVPDET